MYKWGQDFLDIQFIMILYSVWHKTRLHKPTLSSSIQNVLFNSCKLKIWKGLIKKICLKEAGDKSLFFLQWFLEPQKLVLHLRHSMIFLTLINPYCVAYAKLYKTWRNICILQLMYLLIFIFIFIEGSHHSMYLYYRVGQ